METVTSKSTQWKIDTAHSEVTFKVKHLVISTVTGTFDNFSGSVSTSHDDFKNAEISFEALTRSINTRNADRDNHLKSDDFFDAAGYPVLTFKSKSFNGKKLVGDLTIKDQTNEVALTVSYGGTVTDPYNQTKAGFELEGKINRKDYGLTWSAVTETGGVVVSDEVRIHCHIQIIKQ